MDNQIILIDGRNFVFRNHYTHVGLATEDGTPTSVLYGCLSGLLSLRRRFEDTPIVFVWDGGGETWRHRLLNPTNQVMKASIAEIVESKPKLKGDDWFTQQVHGSLAFLNKEKPKPKPVVVEKVKGYKANRVFSNQADSHKLAVSQIPELINVLMMLGLRNFKIVNLEGDDLIGILATAIIGRKLFEKVIIHSTDRDFYQFISPQIRVLKGLKPDGNLLWAQREEIPVLFGIQVEDWLKFRAITGDKSDNIPGFISGVGPKTAVKWLHTGLDPSVKSYADLPYLVKTKISELKAPKVGLVDWEALWGRLHRNYICSQIVTDGRLEMLGENERSKVKNMVGTLSHKSFSRTSKGSSEEAYREFSQWLARYEMADLLGRREEFQQLC